MSRFLFVLDISFDKGGPSEHLLQDVLRCSLDRGHDVSVVLKRIDISNTAVPLEFQNHSRFHYECVSDTDDHRKGFISRYFSEIRYAKRCYDIYSKWGKFDVAFLQSNNTPIFYERLMKELGCPIVFNVQDIFPHNLKWSNQLPVSCVTFPVLKFLQKLGYDAADRIITISDDMKRTLAVDVGLQNSKIEVIYNWSYSDEIIEKHKISKRLFYNLGHTDKFKIVYAGNIGRMQNVELIANAATMMKNEKDVHFYIIGDGSSRSAIEHMVHTLDNVTLLHMQPSKFAESIYAQADINIIPLVNGGINTALPSKTATCLRVDKPIIFCIDSESIFAKIGSNLPGVYITNPDSVLDLVSRIRVLKHSSKVISKNEICQRTAFCSKNNVSRYVDVLEMMANRT